MSLQQVEKQEQKQDETGIEIEGEKSVSVLTDSPDVVAQVQRPCPRKNVSLVLPKWHFQKTTLQAYIRVSGVLRVP